MAKQKEGGIGWVITLSIFGWGVLKFHQVVITVMPKISPKDFGVWNGEAASLDTILQKLKINYLRLMKKPKKMAKDTKYLLIR